MQEHDALERELIELLAVEEKGGDGGGRWGDKKQMKARVRMIKNRLAAKKSREHARTYVQELEGTVESLQSKNEALAQRLAAVQAENEKLKRSKSVSMKIERNENGGNRTSEPAALTDHKSLQLDAAPFLLSILLSALLSHTPTPAAATAAPFAEDSMPQMGPNQTTGRGPFHSVQSPCRAGGLLCFGKSFRLHNTPTISAAA